jgi:hypothetical protein
MRLLLALLLCVVGLSSSTSQTSPRSAPLPHDAYIWQRVWTPHLIAAAQGSSDLIRAWRVLVAESDRTGRWAKAGVKWEALAAAGRPLIAVIRIDGRLDETRLSTMIEQVAATVGAMPATLAGVEIDYDCPTSKLAVYTRFLAGLRARLPAALKLSITALPTWMNGTGLDRLVAPLDEVVLQVHAVDDPRRGLFDPVQAETWVRRFDRPFRVALPAYDVRVTWQPDGALASVEGERPLLTGPAPGQTLRAAPEAVLSFLRALQRAAPDNLAGIAWFRLPTDTDRRAWSRETWRAVITDRLPPPQISAALVPAESPGLWTVILSNEGGVDSAVPRRIRLDPSCTMADGANGFRLASAETLAFESQGGRLRPHDRRVIGWARCSEPQRQLDVE